MHIGEIDGMKDEATSKAHLVKRVEAGVSGWQTVLILFKAIKTIAKKCFVGMQQKAT